MGDLSEHFSRSEFACKCGCGYNTVDAELIFVLEELRFHFKKPVTINSACRCKTHNDKIGGSSNSQHLLGRAADIIVKNVAPKVVWEYLTTRYPKHFGIGKYETFTHIDTRCSRARW